ncbi:M35 family metallo-endopeptidase [Streptomyces coelicoflavus]|uniref:M35 family metallo-endopeptidase n=1 Tax=Streptomyces coelicoflavus TaxID=285562 RepID=UPI0036D01B74
MSQVLQRSPHQHGPGCGHGQNGVAPVQRVTTPLGRGSASPTPKQAAPQAAAHQPVQRAALEVSDGENKRKELLRQAVSAAVDQIDEAIGLLEAFEDAAEERGVSPARHATFVQYFGSGSASSFERVKRTFTRTKRTLRDATIRDHQPGMNVGNEAGAHAYSTHGGPIHLMERFWSTSATERMLTLIHESTHVAVDTHDESGFGQTKALRLARTNPADAITCAYNYEYFAEIARSWDGEHQFVEATGDGSDSELSSEFESSSEPGSDSDPESSSAGSDSD